MRKVGVEKDYTQAHVNALFALQSSERGSLLDLPYGVRAERDFDCILFYLKKEIEVFPSPKEQVKKFSKAGFDGGRYAVSVLMALPCIQENEFKILRVDGEKIPQDAVFRFRREGDVIEKFGGGTQSLKKFFNDKKVPVQERAYVPLIAQEQGNKVYAVCGIEISQQLKINQETKKIFYILLQKKL